MSVLSLNTRFEFEFIVTKNKWTNNQNLWHVVRFAFFISSFVSNVIADKNFNLMPCARFICTWIFVYHNHIPKPYKGMDFILPECLAIQAIAPKPTPTQLPSTTTRNSVSSVNAYRMMVFRFHLFHLQTLKTVPVIEVRCNYSYNAQGKRVQRHWI